MPSLRPIRARPLAAGAALLVQMLIADRPFAVVGIAAQDVAAARPERSQFDVQWDDGEIVSLRRTNDRFDTEYIQARSGLGDVAIRYRLPGGEWQSVNTADLAEAGLGRTSADPQSGAYEARYTIRDPAIRDRTGVLFATTIRFQVDKADVRWTIELKNGTNAPLEIGDLALPLPMNSNFAAARGKTSAVLKHSFISGDGSFLFWMRPNSVGPYLMMTPLARTYLEYWEAGSGERRRDYRVFIHSFAAGPEGEQGGRKWRQPHTKLRLAANGDNGDSQTYGFKLQWADDYDSVRQNLVDDGLVDVQVVPGMTLPSNLAAEIALRSKASIHAVAAEFPEQTQIESLGRRGDYDIYRIRFARLGENRLEVKFGADRHVYLEFFSSEPVETLIKKRGAFLAHSQHHDPKKWYNGLITDWNMDSQVLVSPDNYDRISGFRIYAVTCDDPGLGKPGFVAAKNAEYPVQEEVAALDDYIEHFVWGGLQQTIDEKYPYAIYGIQDWKRNRNSSDPGRNGKSHLWRVYDYPHIVLMYYSMYRVAKHFPEIKTRLTADEYLKRAYGTANAMFTVPMEIEKWSGYWTGFYNEVVILDLIRDLESAGKQTEADTLRKHWEEKVKVFAGGKADLFQSEYPFDSTGFESTHAIAKYALDHAAGEDGRRLGITRADAEKFMDTQMAANLFCRGTIEPAYYYLGSDYRGGAGNAYTLSYMSQMGGGSVLDYGLNYAASPGMYLRLGYASILSSWALLNSGTPESNYGYWYPGKANDGGAGGGFEPAPFGRTWLEQPHHRGSWYYACEIDLGFSGALRAASTVLADDPIFGRICFGGDWQKTASGCEIVPKDGVRRRFHALLGGHRLHLTLGEDRFPADEPIRVNEDLSEVSFRLESDNPAEHTVTLTLSGMPAGEYQLRADDRVASTLVLNAGRPTDVELTVPAGGKSRPFTISKGPEADEK